MHHCTMVHMHRNPVSRETAYAPDRLPPVPNQPKTPNRVIRVETALWRAAQEKAKAEKRSLTSVIVAYLRRYISTPPRRRGDGE
jgi:hypothetical protein